MKRGRSPELLIEIDRAGSEPLRLQIERELRNAIAGGRIAFGTLLPSTRSMAAELGVCRGVVLEAYEQLMCEGWLEARRGSSTRVSFRRRSPWIASDAPRTISPVFRYDFRPALPDVSLFPKGAWLRALRNAIRDVPHRALATPDVRGEEEARIVLAGRLNRVRATSASGDSVAMCSGSAQAMRLACAALRERGLTTVAIEDPASRDTIAAIDAAGLEAMRVPVDDKGLRVDILEQTDARAVIVMPGHQEPTGAVLNAARRARLLAWAKRRDCIIVEQDDCGAEYRYDGNAFGALQGLAPDSVIYVGGVAHTLSPAVSLAWVVVPPAFARNIARRNAGGYPSVIDQLAFADLVERGDLDRHIRDMRVIYRRRREKMTAALKRHFPSNARSRATAGMHVTVQLRDGLTESEAVQIAASHSIAIAGTTLSIPKSPAMLLGYAGVADGDIDDGVWALARALREDAVVRSASSLPAA